MDAQVCDQPQVLLHTLLEMGEAMLAAGADVNRVEDTLSRIGLAYGALRMDAFVVTSTLILTMSLPDGQDLTQIRRIGAPAGTDFTVLESLNALSRRCCAQPIPLQEFQQEVYSLTHQPPQPLLLYLGSALVGVSFSIFFGGTVWDGLSAALFGLLTCFLQLHFSPDCPNRLVFDLITALAVGTGISLWAALFPVLHADKIMIGDIMLLIPGIAMTNAVRDMMVGSPISGIMRLIEALLWAAALAMGFMASIWLTGRFSL